MKHHFSPKFYLNGWAGQDGQLCCIRKVYGKILAEPKTPTGTGYVHDGYKTDHVPDDQAHRVETAFMSPLDNDAARELQRMLAGDARIRTSEERSAWTRFVISLLFRHPAAVESLKSHFEQMHGIAARSVEAEFSGKPINLDPVYTSVAASNMLTEIIDNHRVGPTIFNMKWVIVDASRSRFSMMTSDRPVVMPHGLDHPDCHIMLPISPTKLFIAAHTDQFKRLRPGQETVVVKAINKAVVVQASEFVWAVDDSQLAFVEKHMGSAGERPLMTPERQQAVFDAARGHQGSQLNERAAPIGGLSNSKSVGM